MLKLPPAILAATAPAMGVMDRAARFVHWNEAAATATGYSAAGMLGRSAWELSPLLENADAAKREFERILAENSSGHIAFNWKVRGAPASSLTWSASFLRDPAGQIEYVVCSPEDASAVLKPEVYTRDWELERSDLSRFLHDTVARDLVALSLSVSNLERTLSSRPVGDEVRVALKLIDRCCRDMRVFSSMLEPPSVGDDGFVAAIGHYLDCLRAESTTEIVFHTDAAARIGAPAVQALFLASIQGFVASAIRRHRSRIVISVRHDGTSSLLRMESVAASPDMNRGHSEVPALMSERVRALGGKTEVICEPDRVCTQISIPDAAA